MQFVYAYWVVLCIMLQKSDDEKENDENSFPDDTFLMVSQLHWEDDVVWNGEEIKHKVCEQCIHFD